MKKLTENHIEELAIEDLENIGYQYLYGPDIAPDDNHAERQTYDQVVLTERLQAAITRLNPTIPYTAQADALNQVLRVNSPDLDASNEAFHRLLTEGVTVEYQHEGNAKGDLVWLIDFNQPDNNDFHVVNQMTIIENQKEKRPDVILFVNGLPLVVIELKNAVNEKATVRTAFKQLQTYKQTIPSLFVYNALLVLSDGNEARAGSLSAGFSRFMRWKSIDGKQDASHLIPDLETLIKGMLNRQTLLDLIRHFIVFEKWSLCSILNHKLFLALC